MFSFSGLLVYAVVTAYTPGPNTILSLRHAAERGLSGSFPFHFGVLGGMSLIMLGCAACGGLLAAAAPGWEPVLRAVGAGYMAWLAWTLIRSPVSGSDRTSGRATFLSGALLQFVNPKIYIYGVTALSAYVLPHFRHPAALAGFALFLALVGFSGTVCWAVCGSTLRRVLDRHARRVNVVTALLLLGCAASLYV